MRANISYMLKNWIAWDKKSLVYFLIRVPALVFQPIVTAYIPKAMIDCIEKGVTTRQLILVVVDEPTAKMQRFGTRRQSIMCSLQQHNNAAPGENEKMKEKAKKQTSVWMSVFFLQNAAAVLSLKIRQFDRVSFAVIPAGATGCCDDIFKVKNIQFCLRLEIFFLHIRSSFRFAIAYIYLKFSIAELQKENKIATQVIFKICL